MLEKFARTRLQAFTIHLMISAFIACTFIAGAFYWWYSFPLLEASGAKKIFSLMLVIDMCIGPLLTFVIFNKKKKELSRDLMTIFIIQIMALAYGMYTVTVARPAYMVYAVDRFELVTANEIDRKDLDAVNVAQFEKISFSKYQWVSSVLPEDPLEQNDVLFSAMTTGKDLAQLPQYYADYSASKDEIIRRAKPLSELRELNKGHDELVSKLIKKYPETDRYGFIPLAAKIKDVTVIIDKHDGTPVEIVTLQPW